MTFFDMKVANCKKRTKKFRPAHRARRADFRKILEGIGAKHRCSRIPADGTFRNTPSLRVRGSV